METPAADMTDPTRPSERAQRLRLMAAAAEADSRRHRARIGITDGSIDSTTTWRANFFRSCAADLQLLELSQRELRNLGYSIGLWSDDDRHVDDVDDCERCPDAGDGHWSDECTALNTWRLALLRDERGHGWDLVRYLDDDDVVDAEAID